jgi:hypothetical protein
MADRREITGGFLINLVKALAVFIALSSLGGGSDPAPYNGLVATRGSVLALEDKSYLYANSRSFHFSRTSISQVQLLLSCFVSNNGETAANGNVSYQATIEYPSGTNDGNFTFSNSATGTCKSSGGSVLATDTLTLHTTIPANTKFFVRIWQDAHLSTNTGVMTAISATAYPTGGDGIEVSASSVASKTASLASISYASGFGPILPLALIGTTTLPSVALLGDSRVVGIATSGNSSGDNGELAPSIGPYYGYTSLGSSGETAWYASGAYGGSPTFSRRAAVARYVTDLISNYGVNDTLDNIGLANTEMAITECWSLLGSIKAYQVTIVPVTSSSDNWATTTNQAPPASYTGNANFTPLGNTNVWAQINTWIKGVPTGVTGVFDLANAVQSSTNSGIWISRQTTFSPEGPYTKDGVHELESASIVEMNSEVINAGMITR